MLSSLDLRARVLRQPESLGAEVAALDSVRAALSRSDPDEALSLLRSYLRTFPEGKLLPEARVARIEALAVKGDRAHAASEATRFLEQYPTAPQRARVEALRTRVTTAPDAPLTTGR
jgi:outer membrane protein assembly factor BamD (BamD/ComL family)